MSYSIFIANPSALIAQPGRAVNTFPSGLVRVDQTYLGLTTEAATHRATLAIGNDMPDGDSSPCIDGLKIFPEVQERRREDGFTEYLVSAYGRANTEGQKLFERIIFSAVVKLDIRSLRYDGVEDGGQFQRFRKCTIDRLVWSFCAPKFSDVNIETTETLKVFRLTGQEWQSATLSEFLQVGETPGYFTQNSNAYQNAADVSRPSTTTNSPVSVEKINFGDFEEWKVVYESEFPEFDFQDGIYKIVKAPQFAGDELALSNLRGLNYGAQTVTLGPVYNLATSSGSIYNPPTFVELGESDVTTYNGRARISGDAVIHDFGYVTSNGFGGTGFSEFSRPTIVDQFAHQPAPPPVIQGRATWVTRAEFYTDSEGSKVRYYYNLQSPLNEWFKWTVSNEFGQQSEFTARFIYAPEDI